MAKKKENENLAGGLASSFAQWEYLKEHGDSDPFYADGTNITGEIDCIVVKDLFKARQELSGSRGLPRKDIPFLWGTLYCSHGRL